MEVETKKELQVVFSEEAQSVSIKCDLTPEIKADLEIRWFKETDCVWYYKNELLIEGRNYEDRVNLPIEELMRGNIPLQEMLNNISKSDVGHYLCQVTREGRTEDITLSLKEASGTEMSQQTTTWILNNKAWTDEERIKMTNSALLAVFSTLEKSKRPQTDRQGDYDQNGPAKNLNNQKQGPPDQGQSQSAANSNKGEGESPESQDLQAKKPKKEKKGGTVFSILAGKINDIHKKFIVHLQDRIEDLTEAQRAEDSDVVLIFCPIVSRAGTDIDAALAKIQYSTDSKLTVLVVLHHTFDPEKTVSNSSKCVNKKNLLTVDCLFYEDTGLLDCQRNSDALEESVNWLIKQGHTVGSSFQHKPHGLFSRLTFPSLTSLSQLSGIGNFINQETSGDNKKENMTPTYLE